MEKADYRNLRTVALQALEASRRGGAAHCSAAVRSSRVFSVSFKSGAVENLEESYDHALALRLFIRGRYSEATTSDLRPEAVDQFVERASVATSLIDKDPDRVLPDPSLWKDIDTADLGNFDPAVDQVDKEEKVELARRAEEAAAKEDKEVFHSEAEYRESRSQILLITTAGFEDMEDVSSFSTYAAAYVHDQDNKRRADYAFRQSVDLGGLGEPEEVGREAARRAATMVGAGPVPTGRYPIVVENRVVGRLLGYVMGPLSGEALHRGQSMFDGRQGTRVAAEGLTLLDEPLLVGGLASRRFDREGIAARPMPVIRDGVLKNYYLDTYYARKLGMEPTTGAPSNLLVQPGQASLDELVGRMERGILVTGFLGGNANPLTGDYSVGISGFLVEDGKRVRPVAEINMGGNLLNLLDDFQEAGGDVFPYSSLRAPSLRFGAVAVAGA